MLILSSQSPSVFADGGEMGLSVWSSLYPSLRGVWALLISSFPSLCLSQSLPASQSHRGTHTLVLEYTASLLWLQDRRGRERGVGVKEEACRVGIVIRRVDRTWTTDGKDRQIEGVIQWREAEREMERCRITCRGVINHFLQSDRSFESREIENNIFVCAKHLNLSQG